MWHFLKSPLVRISFSLAMLTVAMLLLTDLLGLVPDTKNAELQSRKVIAESLAVQLSGDIVDRQLQSIEQTLRSVIERNPSMLSGAVRMGDGQLLSAYGDHTQHWTLRSDDKSTATQVQVPLYNDTGRWGSVELRFKALAGKGGWFSFRNSFVTVILFVALAGFLTYLLFLKRTMRELNPDAVIPERVRKALDTLAEGLLVVDKDGFIVFSNMAFARKTGLTPQQLVGQKSTDLDWEVQADGHAVGELPWIHLLAGQAAPTGVRVRLKTALKATYTFTVNVSPITAAAEKIKGALITFDDITEIETKNEELRRTLGKLEKSQREITRQNQELQVLATRDPLTGALNRRSLFQGFETLFAEAREEGVALSCIMVDIDHFKSVNDRFGHAVGDKVIKLLAKILSEHSRPIDLVGRFGGEEFCVVLPEVGAEVAVEIAERMRLAVQEGKDAKFTSSLRITSSFGVTTLSERVKDHNEMLEEADKALYAAKEGGAQPGGQMEQCVGSGGPCRGGQANSAAASGGCGEGAAARRGQGALSGGRCTQGRGGRAVSATGARSAGSSRPGSARQGGAAACAGHECACPARHGAGSAARPAALVRRCHLVQPVITVRPHRPGDLAGRALQHPGGGDGDRCRCPATGQ